jgi:hypothetical protein
VPPSVSRAAAKRVGIAEYTYSRWRKTCAATSMADEQRVKELEPESARLRHRLSCLAVATSDGKTPK